MDEPAPKKKRSWNPNDMETALEAVRSGVKIKAAARNFKVPESTLRDRIKVGNSENPPMGRKATFTPAEEKEICEYLTTMAKKFYGVTQQQLRKLVYDYAAAKNIKNIFSSQTGMAGKCWVYSFLRRNPGISLRHPEPTSLNRILGFNKEEINIFFKNLETLIEKYHFTANRIYNVDETGITTVQKPAKIYAPTGLKQVGKATSAERGQNVTVVCAFSATGIYIPPMFIYPRQRIKASLGIGGPPEAIYECSKSGWINEELFVKWLKHFGKHCGADVQNPILLVLDNHSSHQSLNAYNFCRENGIHLLSLPPHTSHRMQPLDVTFYGPLKSAYSQECDLFMKMHPFEKITHELIAPIFNKAYTRVATMEKATKGFEVTGIYPVNPHIFDEDEILTSVPIVEEPITSNKERQGIETALGNASLGQHSLIDDDLTRSNPASPSIFDEPGIDDPTPNNTMLLESLESESIAKKAIEKDVAIVEEIVPEPSTGHFFDRNDAQPSTSRNILEELSPIPQKVIKTKRQTKKQHSIILTATPLKEEFHLKEERKKLKEMKQTGKGGKNKGVGKGKHLAKEKTVVRKVLNDSESSADEVSQIKIKKSNKYKQTAKINKIKKIKKRKIKKTQDVFSSSEDSEVPLADLCNSDGNDDVENIDLCAICGEFGRDREMWYRCCSCSNWVHKECSGKGSAKNFICDLCE